MVCVLSACTNQSMLDGSTKSTSNESKLESITEENNSNKDTSAESMDMQKEEETTERELTKDELIFFRNFVSSNDNYGFLLSKYSTPKEIDLNQVFFNGAGIEVAKLSEAEEKAYLNAIGENEISTDYVRLTTKQIEDFLKVKTGIALSEVKTKLDWTYLETYDIWISQHGDTNYVPFICASGKQIGENTFLLNCATENEWISDCQLTLYKTGDTYQFVSNQYIDKINNPNAISQIEEQTFTTTLDGWGEITFASYEPNNIFPDSDATFALLDGEEVLFTFPGMGDNNQRGNFLFDGVSAVGFKDYNNNGVQDIIIINEYEVISGPNVGHHFQEVRLYTQHGGNKEYVLDRDITDYLNGKGFNLNISQVIEEASSFISTSIAENHKLDQEEAWNKLKLVYFADIEKEDIKYDETGNIHVVVASWNQCFENETKERFGETVVFYDGEEQDFYNFGCYKEYYNSNGTLFATQTQGWYKVNVYTGEVKLGP